MSISEVKRSTRKFQIRKENKRNRKLRLRKLGGRI